MIVRCTLVDEPLLFDDAREVLEVLVTITGGWHFRSTSEAGPAPIRVISRKGGFRIEEEGYEPFFEDSAVSASCSLIVMLLNRLVKHDAGRLCLHAAAVSMGRTALVFPSTHRAGKSTLATALAFQGAGLLADDILPIDCTRTEMSAIASGVEPRLRLPLVSSLGLRFRLSAWLQAGPDDGYYRYIRLGSSATLPFGTRHDLGAFVFLERRNERTGAQLHAVSKASAMRMLLLQNFGTAAPSEVILDRIDRLAKHVPAYLLRYGNLTAAISLLRRHFSGQNCARTLWSTLDRSQLDFGPMGCFDTARPASQIVRDRVIGHIEGVVLKEAEGSVFLADREHGGIFVLDPIGAAIWKLLEQPASVHEIADLISAAYPDVAPAEIAADVERLIGTLLEKGLARQMDISQGNSVKACASSS